MTFDMPLNTETKPNLNVKLTSVYNNLTRVDMLQNLLSIRSPTIQPTVILPGILISLWTVSIANRNSMMSSCFQFNIHPCQVDIDRRVKPFHHFQTLLFNGHCPLGPYQSFNEESRPNWWAKYRFNYILAIDGQVINRYLARLP